MARSRYLFRQKTFITRRLTSKFMDLPPELLSNFIATFQGILPTVRLTHRPVGAGNDGCATASPHFGRSVNPISTEQGGGHIMLPTLLLPPPVRFSDHPMARLRANFVVLKANVLKIKVHLTLAFFKKLLFLAVNFPHLPFFSAFS